MTRSDRSIPTAGWTLIELVLVVAIIGVLASLSVPQFLQAIEQAKVARAIGDIKGIQAELSGLDSLPASLVAVNRAGYEDPWGNPYVYARFQGPKAMSFARKDRFLVPLNSDYDLYSRGKDGASAPPVTAKSSGDDVIRANNGGFVGLAARY